MNKHSPIKPRASLLERASEKYDFGAALRGGAGAPTPTPMPHPAADPVPVVTGDLVAGSSTPSEAPPTPASDSNLPPALAAVRSFLKETRTGAHAGKIERLAEDVGKPADALLASLVDAGLKLPEKPREKPAYLEQAGEVHWLSMNAKGEIWLNAKPAKLADKDGDDSESTDEKPKRGRSRKADGEGAKETDSPPADASSV